MHPQNFYHQFLDENSVVSITDTKGLIMYVNDKFCEVSKYARHELQGKSHNIINSGYHSKEFFSKMWKTISKGGTWRGEVCNRAKDGSLYWVESFIKPEMSTNGNPIRYYSFRIVITDRKNMEEKRFYSTVDVLGSLFENSNGFQFFIDKECKLISYNKEGAKISGVDKGKYACSGMNGNSIDFNAFLTNFEANFETAQAGKEIRLEQKVDFYGIGISKWHFITYSPVTDAMGMVNGVSLTAVDINKRKEAELDLKLAFEQKNALIESIPDPIFFKDGEGKWLVINAAAQSLFQMDGYDWVGKTDKQMGEERPDFKNIFEACITSDEMTWATGKATEAIEVIEQNGSKVEFNVKKYPIYHNDGRRKALIILSQNITERNINLKKLEKQNKQLNQIAWLQAHKARAPVARIMGLANIFNLKNTSDPINKDVLTRMVLSAEELDEVIHKIMDFTEEEHFIK